jgi:hypothetical protein
MVEATTVVVVSMEERLALPMPELDTELYIPESLLSMELTDKDTFLRTRKGEFQRICFSNLTLTDNEIIHWKTFLTHCAENELEVPEMYLDYQSMVLRYLQATKWDYTKAHAAIMMHNQWTITEMPQLPPSKRAMELLAKGFMYINKRDKRGRCIVICDVPKVAEFLGADLHHMG